MESKSSSLITQKWYLVWVFLPIGAYYIGMTAGTAFLFLFPIFLVAAQYLAIRLNPATEHAAYWWWFLPVGLFFFVLACQALTSIFNHYSFWESSSFIKTVTIGILSFYISQMAAEFLLPSIFEQWESGWWVVGNTLAAFVWIGVFLLICHFKENPDSAGDRFWYSFGYVLPSLFANAITGYFLHVGTKDE